MKLFRKTVDESGNVAEYGAYVDEREAVQYYYCERGRPAHALLPCARARFWGRKKDTAVPLCLFFRSVGKQKKEEESKKFCCCFGIVLEAAVVWEGGEGRDGERS
jgi:hypothetical protein